MQKQVFMAIGAATFLSGLAAAPAFAQDIPPTPPNPTTKYSPYPAQDFPNQVQFGDTHLHTSYSTDAGKVGNTLTPEDALRFERGEVVKSSRGFPAKLLRPLDFVVITDHPENLGLAPAKLQSPYDETVNG